MRRATQPGRATQATPIKPRPPPPTCKRGRHEVQVRPGKASLWLEGTQRILVAVFSRPAPMGGGRAAFWRQAQHFRKVYRFRAGAAFSYFWHGRIANLIGTDAQGGACRFRGRGSIFARSNHRFRGRGSILAGSRQHSRKVKYRFRGRRSNFARCGTDFVAGAILS